jgi:hypothetical protein
METHLDENEIALYVDAIEAENQDELSKEILDHVEECSKCKMEIVEVYDLRMSVIPSPRDKREALCKFFPTIFKFSS